MFWTVIYARLLLCVLSICIFILLLFIVSKFRQEWVIFAFSFIFIIGDIFQSLWFFQGIEKMVYIAIMNLISKMLYTAAIFIFIKHQADYIFVPLLYSLSQVFVGIYAVIVVTIGYRLMPIRFSFKKVLILLKETKVLFISNVSMVTYLKLPVVLLGILCGNIFVGYYSAAEKLISALRSIQNSLNQTFYPYICKVTSMGEKQRTKRVLRKMLIIYVFIGFTMSILSYIFSKQIIVFLYGKSFYESIHVLQILSLLFLLLSINDIFIFQTMLSSGMKKEYTMITIFTCIIFILAAYILIPAYKHNGAAFSLIISQIVTLVTVFLASSQKKSISFKFGYQNIYEN